jgi:SagB-type dehydrogenase family enzyme
MKNYLFRAYHQASSSIKTVIPVDEEEWPREWLDVEYKSYPRFRSISLDESFFGNVTKPLSEVLKLRKSTHKFTSVSRVPYSIFSKIIYESVCKKSIKNNMHSRAYPSAGFRFPIETYILCFEDQEIDGHGTVSAGVYHLDVLNNALISLPFNKKIFNIIQYDVTQWYGDVKKIFLFTMVFNRTSQKYDERAYRFILLEIGHMAQNIALNCAAHNVLHCELGRVSFEDAIIEELLCLNTDTEQFVHALAIGDML